MLFRVDPAPFQYKVNQLEASLAQARQQVKQLTAGYEQARTRRPSFACKTSRCIGLLMSILVWIGSYTAYL
ncbi:hypothetical protein ACE10Z_19485 [Bradyrhizobium sp. Pha-3]|uniref:hypothetical protein n=1 Tax=Bradyrhizobium sp. Pha-3 TaxID=208375 RepID=UPI0035D4FD8C